MPERVKYFAYGSNLHPARMTGRAPANRALTIASLPEHQLRFHKRSNVDGSGKCSICRTGNGEHRVIGVVYEIDVAELEALDAAEGAGNGYERIETEVVTYSGRHRVFTYRAQASHIDNALEPLDWYLELVIAGARHHGFPADYIGMLEKVATRPDSDARRCARYRALLDR